MAENNLTNPDPAAQAPSVGHQEDRLNYRAFVIFGIGLIGIVAVIFIILSVWMGFFSETDASMGADKPMMATKKNRAFYPGPKLQDAPELDMEAMRYEVREQLGSYGWVDEDSGIARIPIDRAIEATARDGLPVRQAPESSENLE